jgi:hypothetical protein
MLQSLAPPAFIASSLLVVAEKSCQFMQSEAARKQTPPQHKASPESKGFEIMGSVQ